MLKLWNTLARKKESFRNISGKTVKMYTCGPTVYDFAHIGNLRTYIFEDVLRRILKLSGYKIKQVMNITDVDDKIIKKVISEQKSISVVTKPYTKAFFDDLKKLNIEKAEYYTPATEHIKEMVDLIKKLIARGFAYNGEDKSVYFDISKFKNYGRLSGLSSRQLKPGARVSADEYNKDDARDFVLWKSRKPSEPYWQSPWGPGRPGWHIECSAMSMKYLGKTIDIHAGAVDLIFPHHENEIAQSEAATGKKFVRYWVHGEHLLFDGQKMSKSLNTFYTLKDIESRGYDPLAFRYLTLTAHYRSKLNFTFDSLSAANSALKNLKNDVAKLRAQIKSTKKVRLSGPAQKREKAFFNALSDDLNAPKALAELISAIKDGRISPEEKYLLVIRADEALGLSLSSAHKQKIPKKVEQIVSQREILRGNKQFIQSDLLRKRVERLGYRIEDAPEGPRLSKNENGN